MIIFSLVLHKTSLKWCKKWINKTPF